MSLSYSMAPIGRSFRRWRVRLSSLSPYERRKAQKAAEKARKACEAAEAEERRREFGVIWRDGDQRTDAAVDMEPKVSRAARSARA